MKKRDLERQLVRLGWWVLREGGNHEIWTNGEHGIPVPRHKDLDEFTAKGILKEAKKNSGRQEV